MCNRLLALLVVAMASSRACAFAFTTTTARASKRMSSSYPPKQGWTTQQWMSTEEEQKTTTTTESAAVEPEVLLHEEPEDAVIHITNSAMTRLKELRAKSEDDNLILRMGVRNGGCSGLSYVMDFSTADAIDEDDAVDTYTEEGITCVVDAKSLLYLYGLQLDYSDELIGGGFKFFNPNAEESCGCGSSFGV